MWLYDIIILISWKPLYAMLCYCVLWIYFEKTFSPVYFAQKKKKKHLTFYHRFRQLMLPQLYIVCHQCVCIISLKCYKLLWYYIILYYVPTFLLNIWEPRLNSTPMRNPHESIDTKLITCGAYKWYYYYATYISRPWSSIFAGSAYKSKPSLLFFGDSLLL